MKLVFGPLKNLLHLGPRAFIKQEIQFPLIKYIQDTATLYKTRTQTGVNNLKQIIFRIILIASLSALLIWLSILMYLAFYYVYVPPLKHERPVFLKFRSCGTTWRTVEEPKGMCSFPSAYIQLTTKQQLLMLDQPYKVYLELEMPESPVNKELGMFMVCVDFKAQDGKTLANSCRSTMLHYKSALLDTLYKLIYIPFFIFGSIEEKQTVYIELFSDYTETEYKAVTDIYIEIQSKHIEIYSAKFSVNAEFSGLRYIMFNWPILSATIGIIANLFFIALTCLISWYQVINSEEYLRFIEDTHKNDYILESDGHDSDISEEDYVLTGIRKSKSIVSDTEE